MIRGNRIVIPLFSRENEIAFNRSIRMAGDLYHADEVERVELSLDECEAIITHLPQIIEFVITERPKVKKE
jgi:hypothetical protein